ncbi:recombinase family protein [Acutalibacter sp.]|uniref:recombinase family protein n=1 Tax=Acutalibacter sp. TaxID=1918636 RepID=UPI00216DD08B|nr:recombinase family protein [Acutalibacter sp.]
MRKPAKKAADAVTTLKAAIYIRVSTQYQVDRASLPVQREELINYAKYALDITDCVVFEDAGYSAKNTDRPDYQRMMARVRAGEFSHLLVWKIDRISRNLLDFAAMYAELKKLGIVFVSKNEQFDTSSAMGEAMLKIILVFAELERNMTSERVSAVMLSRANDGIWNGGKVPFGYAYDKDSKQFSIIEDEAQVVLHIYDLYESVKSLTTVAKSLNEKGVRSRTGKPWNPTTVRTMLTNPFYAGTYRYNYWDESSKSFTVKDKDEWVLVLDHHPAIVTPERQEIIAVMLQSKQRGWAGAGMTYQRKNIHIFAGLLKCGCCGYTMIASPDRERSDGWRPSVYKCSRQRRFGDCDNKYVSDVTLGPFALNFIANLIRASNSFGKSTSIETLEKKLLRGDMFSQVDHIERPGLEELYTHLRSGFDSLAFETRTVDAAESGAALQERDLLLSEKRRLERALNRLKSLFLYGEEAMAEKDYLVERKQLMDALEEKDARLEELEAEVASSITMSDEEFMAKASYFILSQQLQDKRFVDYEKFIRKIDPQIVKDFLNSVVTNFCIKNGLTASILFKNGLEVQFSYKAQE